MSNLCRVCMCTDFKCAFRVHEYSGGSRVSEQIMTICNVKISKDDGLPDEICAKCLHQLRNAFTFKFKCEETDTVLRKSYASMTKNAENITESSENVLQFKAEVEALGANYDDEINESDGNSDSKLEICSNILPDKIYNVYKLKHKCEDCGKSFRTKLELKSHLKQKGFVCEGCKRQFKTKFTIENHLRFKNRDCKLISDDKTVTVEGVGKNRIFSCTQCDYKTSRLIHMRPHLVTHTGLKPFACDLCQCAYTQLGPLNHHKQLVHEKKDLSITCEVCGKTLPSKRHFQRHLRVHSDGKYLCDLCNARLKSKSTLREHMTRHMGVKNFTCEICASSFFTPPELYNHMRIHKSTENRRLFQCPKCEYRATKKYCLQKHLTRHSDEKPYSCRDCGQMYETAHLLDKHMRIHNKSLKCPVCESKYSTILYLKRHLSKHHRVDAGMSDLKVQLFNDRQGEHRISS